MRKVYFAFALLILLCGNLAAQNYGQNGFGNQFGKSASGMDSNRYDRNGNPIDTTAVIDANTIPIGLASWVVDDRLGTMSSVPIDTVQHNFQNMNDTGGPEGQYSYLGNLGAPRFAHVFFERKEPTQAFFTDPYDFTLIRPDNVVFTNTKSPFTNLTYFKHGDARTGEERFKAYFAINANKRTGFGFNIDYTYGRGKYQNQSTALFNGDLFAYYRGDHYEMHASFINDNLKMAENGGITNDNYVKRPLDMAEGKKTYSTSEIPVNLSNIWNHNRGYHLFLTHRYNLGIYRDNPDEQDTLQTQVFLPVTSFIHTLKVDMNKREYISYDHSQNQAYFRNNFLGTDSTDVTKHTSVKNTFGISIREGFSRWAKAGLTAFITHEYRGFTLNDSLRTPGGQRASTDYRENVLSVGGQLIKEQGRTLHYNVIGELGIAGEDAGQFSIEGKGDLNFRLKNDTVRFEANAYIKNLQPVFYFRHFHSKHYWWDNDDLSKVMRTRVEGKLSIDRWQTQLSIGAENIKNYTYLDNTSVVATPATETQAATYRNDAAVRQHTDNLQVFNATLSQNFRLGIFHLDNVVTYQKSSNEDVLPLPQLVLYHNLYMRFGLAKKVLMVEMGADLRYFSEYYAPDYAPAIGQFYLQNPETRYKLGGFPLVNGYVNLHLKRTRIFLEMYNLVQPTGDKSYFQVAHYPLNPRGLKLGISWNFFD